MAEVVQSVDRALEILELLSCHVDGLAIKEISEKLELHKSTVHRLLGTLIYKGYVEQNELNNRYLVTLKLFQLGSRKVENTDVIETSKPYLNQLAQFSGEVVHLVLRDGTDIIYVDKVEGNQTIRMHSKIGNRSPMYCTGVGKAIMSTLEEDEIKMIWENSEIKRLTEHTIIELAEMHQTIEQIKLSGYALDNEENELGVKCVAVSIKDYRGISIAAISISGPKERMTNEKIITYSQKLKKSCQEISERLGYNPM
ncbi:IclR family transcriptional regulator [Vallitalea okinawensis]|uniref:IclR family transcriptional regulator n=1 Tax=Vallitalea okinawensis TaxID=2078660 RepID=UPI000CFAD327|nr:IclR family transcriptional regulator [Vallitalea okinawensis]